MKLNRMVVGVMTALMLASSGASRYMTPTEHLADKVGKPDLETLFPRQFGVWRVDANVPVILPAPDVQARLDAIYNQVLSRTYVDDRGQRIMLSVAYGGDQSDGTRIHRPEVCYPAQGFQILSNRVDHIGMPGREPLKVRRLESKLEQRLEPITYWVVVGDSVVVSASEQKLAQLRYGLRGVIPDGLLVRVSSIDPEASRAFSLQQQYIADLARSLTPQASLRVFGK
ncbi:exosortase-associated protein EpsI, B-type [Roseateles sp.]|uniref:exosortase-associated protein EpsI, B-type n=1 Tax=Roseateles sp. TaxID=1971397 RepID=UPI0025F051EF|nr:exosortase-associated protein EpsI, B-type [Roseateles sp.]MBV8033891.1 EpsI family protein [Roseateles sp.]